ncbi:MAG TPA: hypothetical protein VJQ55_04165 [Candidatus Binatia bacterium]|nr:hypothetical protein [Candidatus Binatia bacterium]
MSWNEGPWDLPAPGKGSAAAPAPEPQTPAPTKVASSTDAIVSRNLFDPERGAGATREAEETSRAFQRIRNMILIGTIITDNNRIAILQEGSAPAARPGPPAQAPATMRLKLGDNVEGYRLAEIGDKKVVFAKDSARIEVVLDYFRKVEVAAPRQPPTRGQIAPSESPAPGPRVIPNLPRRGRIPVPGSQNPDS